MPDSSPHSERLDIERAIERIEWMHYLGTKSFPHDAGWSEGCELCNAEAEVRETLLAARQLEEQYAALEEAAREVAGSPFGSIDQRAFYRLREVLGD